MDKSSQHIYSEIYRMSHSKDQHKQYQSRDAASEEGAHGIYNLRNNSGGKPQRKKSCVGQDIRNPAGYIIQVCKGTGNHPKAFLASGACNHKSYGTDDAHPHTYRSKRRRVKGSRPAEPCR